MTRDDIMRLALEAGFDVNDHGEWVGDKDGKCLEQFAELIVRECLVICRMNNNSGEGGEISKQIREYFGVE